VTVELIPVDGIPEVKAGDVLAELIAAAADLRTGDVVVVTQKIVSKAENRLEPLDHHDLAARRALVERESVRILRRRGDLIISETSHGFVCANAGIDLSNLPGEDAALLLPEDPDGSARALRAGIEAARGVRPAVVLSDSFGRAWRMGQVDVAIGAAGLLVLDDWRGRSDAHGRELRATVAAMGDAVAAMADLARSKDAGEPAVLVRGLERFVTPEDGPGAAPLTRPKPDDLFR